MSVTLFRRYSHWLLPLLAAATVVLVGARLITVSVHERAQQMRLAAQSVAVRHARAIETELRALSERTRREAQRAATTIGRRK